VLVRVRKKTCLAPAFDDARHNVAVLVMMRPLLFGHRYEEGVVDAGRKLVEHLGLAAAEHDRRQRRADAIEIAIADYAACLVPYLVIMQQAPSGAEPVPVDELDDGDQFLEPVLQRCASEHDGVGALNALQGACGDGVPVLDALRLVNDDEIRRPGGDQIEIAGQRLVVGDFAVPLFRVLALARGAQAMDHLGFAFGKAGNLALPLMLKRSRTNDEHALDAAVTGQQFHGGDGLYGFAKTHFVADQGTSGACRKQCALGLVGIERDLEQSG
jgi:hypothetical protein